MGRPSKFTEAIAAEICERLAAGESLRLMVRDKHMPDERTVYRWLEKDETFRQKYARAREYQAEAFLEDIIEIADDGTNDWMRKSRADGSDEEVLNNEHIQRSRLRVDARKWAMSKLAPKKYGDKVTNEHSGPNGGAIPIEHMWGGRK